MPPVVIDVRGADAGRDVVHRAVQALAEGQLVAFPTETVYGVAAVATHAEAMERLRELKARPKRPFSVHVANPCDAKRYVKNVPEAAGKLMERAWPGPITLILPTGGRLADERLDQAGMFDVLCSDGRVGLRCPDHPVCRAMLDAVEDPVVAPSANRAGEPSPRSGADVLDSLDGEIDLLIDAGATKLGKDSTTIAFTGDRWEILREGAYSHAAIRRLLCRRFLFVCTGNTCRSPMAAGLARKLLAERLGCTESDLDGEHVVVESAGIAAADGHPASIEAIRAAEVLGTNIQNHRSQLATTELIQRADVVFCMTEGHVQVVADFVPGAAGKVLRLDPEGDLLDPIGAGLDVYVGTAEQILRALQARLNEDFS